MRSLGRARLLALLVPSALMAGALGSQYIGGLYPCEMCHWQRWPHYAAIGFAILAFVFRGEGLQRSLVLLAALGILASGAIGVFHAGVEYKWWEGLTTCSLPPEVGGGDFLESLKNAPLVRCDEVQWSLFGVSLAGFNAIISISASLFLLNLLRKRG